MNIPTFLKNESKHPAGYIWSRSQVSNILKNQTYIGSVVGGKFQKVSHKVDKIKHIKTEEHVVVNNKHQALIDEDLWNKAQEKLAKYKFVKKAETNHPLKKYVYCAECGAKATYRSRHDVRKSGAVKIYNMFVCSRKNIVQGCKCKIIRAEILEEMVKEKIIEEMRKLVYSENEIINIFERAEKLAKNTMKMLDKEINKLNIELSKKDAMLDEIYNDKLNNFITQEDFNKFYNKVIEEKNELLKLINSHKAEQEAIKNGNAEIKYGEIINLAKRVLKLEITPSDIYDELIEKIEFDSNKTINITFKFGNFDTSKNKIMEVLS